MPKKRPTDEFDLTLQGRVKLTPRNGRQEALLQALKFNDIVIAAGPAGTGKTYLAAHTAATQLVMGKVDKVVISRPKVAMAGEAWGELPGGIKDKLGPWLVPIVEAMGEAIGAKKVKELMVTGQIEIVPFAFMRGRSFKDCFVVLDEFQNTTPAQAQAAVTRIGENCTYVLSGDLQQSDISGLNGLADLINLIDLCDLPFPVIQFLPQDVVRSKTCRLLVDAYLRRDSQLPPRLLKSVV